MMATTQDHHHHHHHQRQQSRVFYELSSLVLNLLRSPPSPEIHFSDHIASSSSTEATASARREAAAVPPITPAGFASLMLGISLSLMLCGSVTFFIGFMLFPWVIGLFIVFYFVGFVSSLSLLGRAFICYAISPSSSPRSPRKDIPAWKLMWSLCKEERLFGWILLLQLGRWGTSTLSSFLRCSGSLLKLQGNWIKQCY